MLSELGLEGRFGEYVQEVYICWMVAKTVLRIT
jgi:hypothetical protein